MYDKMGIYIPQKLDSGKYTLRATLIDSVNVASETVVGITRNVGKKGIKLKINLPEKSVAKNVNVEMCNLKTYETYSESSDDLLNNELIMLMPKGKYRFMVNATTEKGRMFTTLKT